MGGGPNLQEEVPVACEPVAQWYSSREHQKACLVVLPAQDRALPDRAIPQLDKELPHPAMLVVPVPNTDRCWTSFRPRTWAGGCRLWRMTP